jgi:hypothetical protein
MKIEKTQYRVTGVKKYLGEDGTEKNAYPPVGIAFLNPGETDEEYSISVRLDSIPINFTGELCLFLPKRRWQTGDAATDFPPSGGPR